MNPVTYCMNVHPGESLDAIVKALEDVTLPLRDALGVDDEYADQKEQRERGAEKGNQKRAGAETAVHGTELLFSFSVPSMPAPRRAYSARSFRTARIVSPSSRPEYCASLSVFTSVPTSTRTEACVACML